MPVVRWMLLGLFGPVILLVTFGYAFAFPWHTLGVLAFIASPFVIAAWIGWQKGGEDARIALAAIDAKQRRKDDAATRDYLLKSLSPDYDQRHTIIPAGTVTHRRREDTPLLPPHELARIDAEDPLPTGGPYSAALRAGTKKP